jgi:hypothetical protein
MTTDYHPGQAWLPPGGTPPAPSYRHPAHRSLGEALPFGAPVLPLEPEPGPEPGPGGEVPGGPGTGRSWRAFHWALVVGLVLTIMVTVTVVLLVPSLTAAPVVAADGISADWLEDSIIDQGRFRGADGRLTAPRAADCAGTRVGADGAGIYHCTIELPGEYRSVVDVTVAGNGEWTTA